MHLKIEETEIHELQIRELQNRELQGPPVYEVKCDQNVEYGTKK